MIRVRKNSWRNSFDFPYLILKLCLILLLPLSARAAGVTVITHGLNGNADGWVTGMANEIPTYYNFPGTNYTFYKLYFIPVSGGYQLTWARFGGSTPATTDSGEILIALDWSQLADGNSFNTYQIATVVAAQLMNQNFISELNGHALSELPIHLIGHSRGGSLMCETSRLLGTNGVWVDHLTTLDPHPLNDPNFPLDGLLYSAHDAPCATYQNVLFHDNYWEHLDIFVYGESVFGAYVRYLTDLSGGYENVGDDYWWHSNVHLWYHGTLDFDNPASDGDPLNPHITSTERYNWWDSYEDYGTNAGFLYSLIGQGDRTSSAQPEGDGHAIRDGYNQAWDLGAGQSLPSNRSSLTSNDGNWPNVMKLNLVSPNQIQQGSNALFSLYFQWAQPSTSNATINLYLDDDFNPNNGNGHLIKQVIVSGTGTSGGSISYWSSSSPLTVGLNATNAPVGYHSLYAQISGGGRTRYLYAPEIIQVLPAVIITTQPTNQTVWAGTNVTFSLAASGVPTLKYQWLKNGANIAGATNANYTTNNVTINVAGTYSCLVSNAFGNAISSNAVLTVLVPVTTIPTISITSPTSGQRWSNAMFNVIGTAGDKVAVSNVLYSLNGLAWTAATTGNNWTNWTAQVTLTPGTNTIAAYAVDTSDNNSLTNSVSFDFAVTNQLQVRTIGLGTISPNYSNAWLEIGRNYSITSAPASGFVFTNWLVSTNWIGSALTTGTNLQFMMASNLTLQANFLDVTKPILIITAPTSGQHMTNALATVVGTASDNWKISAVWYQLTNGILTSGTWNLATTTDNYTNWTTTVTLAVGTNTVKAYAVDLGGNYSTTSSVSVLSSNTFKLQLNFTMNQPLTSTGLNFTLQISSNLNGHIQISTNLTSWATLTNFVGTNTTLNFRDSAATNYNRRFYRAVIP